MGVMDIKQYLLSSPRQKADFLAKYPGVMERCQEPYLRWLRKLPLMEWSPLVLRPGEEEVAVGIICLLYQSGYVNITFHGSLSQIRREPQSEQEFLDWAKRNGWHGPGIDDSHEYDSNSNYLSPGHCLSGD